MGRIIFIVCMFLILFGCNAESEIINSMESSQKAANERASRSLVAFMSLEIMFPNEKVRALAYAAGKGKVKKIEELVIKGIDVNSKGTSNATPLFWAMRNFKGFTKLLELEADPNVIFDDGSSVIHWAVNHRDKRFLEKVLEYGGNPNLVAGQFKETPLFKAAGPEGKSKAGILLDAGADINAQDLSGDTPMMVAAGLGQFDLVYELLERGADFTIKNKKGDSLLDVIVFRKRTMDPKNELTRWMERIIEWLNMRGVTLSK